MSEVVIKTENISKQYRLGQVGTGTVSHDLNRWWAKLTGKEDPTLKVGDINDRTSKGKSDFVWSLKDINFEINKGDTVGIIGRNGAGKSTLLKILSKVTGPTTGSIKVKGRIASLLEVGTGFHPELTGKENIFLNGAILGMKHHEIKRKFDEIVDFSGVERYIDTPVKRYSSGMYVRLAFAVAAHLESEILIVDEVLAVGDAEFQKKCLGKMGEVSKGEGRTVLFVSHNIGAVKTLCTKGAYLKNGQLDYFGEINDTVSKYMRYETQEGISLAHRTDREGNGLVIVSNVAFKNRNGEIVGQVFSGDYLKIEIFLDEKIRPDYSQLIVACSFTDPYQQQIVSWISDEMNPLFDKYMDTSFCLEIPNLTLRPGVYDFNVQISFNSTAMADITDIIMNAAKLTIEESSFFYSGKKIRSGYSSLITAEFKKNSCHV